MNEPESNDTRLDPEQTAYRDGSLSDLMAASGSHAVDATVTTVAILATKDAYAKVKDALAGTPEPSAIILPPGVDGD